MIMILIFLLLIGAISVAVFGTQVQEQGEHFQLILVPV